MLPNLRTLQKQRNIAITPDLSSKRFQNQRSEHNDVNSLKSQIETLQRQLEYVQSNKSFVMKIATPTLCSQCQKLKQQLDTQLINEKILKRNYESKIEELQKLQLKVAYNRLKTTEPENQYEELLSRIKQIDSYQLFITNDNQLNSTNQGNIQFVLKSLHEEDEVKLEQFQKQNEDQNNIITRQTIQIKQGELQVDQQRSLITNLQNQVDLLKKQLGDGSDKKKSTHQTFQEEYSQKMRTEPAQEKTLLQQLLYQNQSLKDKLIQQHQFIDKQAQENQISKHLIRIELLETELRLSLRCCRCQNLFDKPRTYIPCGHSCCEKCYKPNCDKCDTEAVYRNRQFDELIKVYYIIKDTKVFIQGCLLQLQN